ncbi:hypothetical protein Tco_0149225 [Tanacetum coccineum]
MDCRGAGSCVMLGYAPPCPSFSVSPSVKLSVASRGGARKGGSCVLIPDLVVMVKVGASDVSSRQAYLLGWVALLTFISLMGSSSIITNQGTDISQKDEKPSKKRQNKGEMEKGESALWPVRYSNHIGEEISCHLWYASVEIPGKCVVRRLIRA